MKKRKRRRSLLFVPVTVLLIIIIFVFGMSIFFRVSNISVVGNERYTNSAIIESSGIKDGDSILFMDTDKVQQKILDAYADIGSVSVQKTLPNKVMIVIGESEAVASVASGGSWWIIDENGRILESTTSGGAAGTISVVGISPQDPQVGAQLNGGEEQELNVQYLANVLGALKKMGLCNEVTTLNVSNISSISFDYRKRFTVNFGSGEDPEYKLSKLISVAEQLKSTDRGTIDVSKEGESRFIPET